MKYKFLAVALSGLLSSTCFAHEYDLNFVEKTVTFTPQQTMDVKLDCAAGYKMLGMLPSMEPKEGFSIGIQNIETSETRLTLKSVQHLGGLKNPRRPDGILTIRIACYK